MIKQRYDFSFFYDNYKYRYKTMFDEYYKRLEAEYRYFILVTEDINKVNSTMAYRSNLDIDDILDQLKNMKFQISRIIDTGAKFPDTKEYWYNKICGVEQIVKIYKDGNSETRKFKDDSLIYMYFADYKRKIMSARLDKDYIRIYFGGYTITSKLNKNEITVHKSVPLSPGAYLKYNSDHKEMVQKVLNKVVKSNVRGFYNELILTIKNEFRIA